MKNVFTEKQVGLAALIGGPIPPGLLIYQNYKALGKDKEAYITIASTLVFTFTLFYILLQLPESIVDKVPDFVFTASYGLIVFAFFRFFMTKDINEAVSAGATTGSNWTVAGLTVLGIVLNLGIIFGLASQEPYFEGKLLTIDGNDLYYDPAVPDEDVKKIGGQLQMSGFFAKDYGNIVRLQLIGDEYLITVAAQEEFWNDSNLIAVLTSLKWLIATEFGKPTKMQLESVSVSGKLTYKDV